MSATYLHLFNVSWFKPSYAAVMRQMCWSADHQGRTEQSYEQLSDATGLSKRTISGAVGELVRWGVLAKQRRRYGRNQYAVVGLPFHQRRTQMVLPGFEKCAAPICAPGNAKFAGNGAQELPTITRKNCSPNKERESEKLSELHSKPTASDAQTASPRRKDPTMAERYVDIDEDGNEISHVKKSRPVRTDQIRDADGVKIFEPIVDALKSEWRVFNPGKGSPGWAPKTNAMLSGNLRKWPGMRLAQWLICARNACRANPGRHFEAFIWELDQYLHGAPVKKFPGTYGTNHKTGAIRSGEEPDYTKGVDAVFDKNGNRVFPNSKVC